VWREGEGEGGGGARGEEGRGAGAGGGAADRGPGEKGTNMGRMAVAAGATHRFCPGGKILMCRRCSVCASTRTCSCSKSRPNCCRPSRASARCCTKLPPAFRAEGQRAGGRVGCRPARRSEPPPLRRCRWPAATRPGAAGPSARAHPGRCGRPPCTAGSWSGRCSTRARCGWGRPPAPSSSPWPGTRPHLCRRSLRQDHGGG
jgi:hypothetical protein